MPIDGPSAEAARALVNAIANPQMPEVGERFLGTVVKTTTFGAFVSLLPGKDGLLHISEVRKLVGGKRIDNVDDVLKVGQKIQVEIKKIDHRGKLSLAAVIAEPEADTAERGGSGRHGAGRRLIRSRSSRSPAHPTGCAGLRRSRPVAVGRLRRGRPAAFHPEPTCTRGSHAVVPLRG